jgi:regulator of nucleoside diphosphate kinase
VITIHTRLQVLDLVSGERRELTLVLPHESDASAGRISVLAPLGTALLGYRAGDEVEWLMPGGLRRLRIEYVRPPAEGRVAPAQEVFSSAIG